METPSITFLAPATQQTRTKALASVLPPDILLKIFFILRDIHSSFIFPFWDWIVVTKICRLWRNVAVECPNLWSEIPRSCQSDRVRGFLERSQQVQIRVDLEIDSSNEDGILDLFEGHMWRVREFKVTMVGRGFDSVKARLLEMTHHTKILALQYTKYPFESQNHAGIISDLTDTLPTVQLDSLSLNSVALPWSNMLYHGLTELSIGDTEDMLINGLLTIWHLMDVLGSCPNLIHLKLRHLALDIIQPDLFTVNQIRERRLELTHLQSLMIADTSFPICLYLLTMFPINKNTTLDVSFCDYRYSIPFYRLPSHIYNERQRCKSLSLLFNETSFTVKSNPVLDSSGDSLLPETSISVHVPFESIPGRIMDAVAAMIMDSFWEATEDLVISFEKIRPSGSEYDMDGYTWFILFEGLPKSLKRLTIILPLSSDRERECSDGLPEGIHAFYELNPASKPNAQEVQELTICNADFSTVAGEGRRELLIQHTEDSTVYTRRTQKIFFLNCKGASSEKEEFVFKPQSWPI